MNSGDSLKQVLIEKINESNWWHTPPKDKNAYEKRGKFLASTWEEAFFYGRPYDEPEQVEVKNPVYGTSEKEILEQLFPGQSEELLRRVKRNDKGYESGFYDRRIELDAKMCSKAKELGFDSIVLLGSDGREYLEKNQKPPSVELNLLYPYKQSNKPYREPVTQVSA